VSTSADMARWKGLPWNKALWCWAVGVERERNVGIAPRNGRSARSGPGDGAAARGFRDCASKVGETGAGVASLGGRGRVSGAFWPTSDAAPLAMLSSLPIDA